MGFSDTARPTFLDGLGVAAKAQPLPFWGVLKRGALYFMDSQISALRSAQAAWERV